ncbi:MAG: universal stress protein [Nitrospiraceae bacterium]
MRVLLAVDGSEVSQEAARACQHLTYPDELIVLHTVQVPRLAYPATTPGMHKEFSVAIEQAMKEEGQQTLDRLRALLPANLPSVSARLETGSPAEVILSQADAMKADLIVLGSRGLGQIQEWALGSVSHRITAHATCATWVVKAPLPQLQHVLTPVDSPEDAEAVVAFFAKKPLRQTVTVTVLHVVPFMEPVRRVGIFMPEEFRKELVVQGEKCANEVAARLSKLGYSTKSIAVVGLPSVAILEKASAVNADLIAMRSHSRGAISRFFIGSVSHAVLHQAKCSVLLIR